MQNITFFQEFSDLGYYKDFCELGYEGTLGHPSSVIGAFRQLQERAKSVEVDLLTACQER